MFLKRKTTQRQAYLAAATSLIAALLLATLPAVTGADDDDDDDDERWEHVSLSGSHQDQQFLAGERVEVSNVTTEDDIFAAGGDLDFDSVVAEMIVAAGGSLRFKDINADDLVLVAGGSLRFEDVKAEELILAGGEISFSGQVEDDIVAATCPFCPIHGRLHLKERAQIGDDARLAGREVVVDGRVGGNLYAAGQRVELSGQVGGDAAIEAERIVLKSGARIAGDLRYASPNELELRDGASIAGQIIQVEPRIPFDREAPEHPVWIAVLVMLGFFLALVVLGVALQLAIPGILIGSNAIIRTGLWACLGRGLVLALLGPAVAALLMFTVIGAPIGILIFAALVLLYAMAFVAISYSIGLYVGRLFGKSETTIGTGSRIMWTSVGILLLVIVGIIPLIGWAIGMLAIICGLGAVISQLGPLFRRTSSAPAAG
jgi:cytoskeletal protein CcmA (bactofilin family)